MKKAGAWGSENPMREKDGARGVEVRGAHASKTAKREAASFVVVLRWASPLQRIKSVWCIVSGRRRLVPRAIRG